MFSLRREEVRRQIRLCPPGGEDHGVGLDDVAQPGLLVEAVGAEDRPVLVDQQPGDVHGVQDGDLQLLGPVDQGPLDLQARVVPGEGGAPPGVRTEEALRDPAVLLPGEVHAVAFQVPDALLSPLGDDLHDVRVGQAVALPDGVRGVLLPGVLRVHGGQDRVDAPGGQGGVGVGLRPLADGEHVPPQLGQLDGGAQSRAPRADDEHLGADVTLLGGLVQAHGELLRSGGVGPRCRRRRRAAPGRRRGRGLPTRTVGSCECCADRESLLRTRRRGAGAAGCGGGSGPGTGR